MSGSSQVFRVYRGGGWSNTPANARLLDRNGRMPDYVGIGLGCRIVRLITPAERLGELAETNVKEEKEPT